MWNDCDMEAVLFDGEAFNGMLADYMSFNVFNKPGKEGIYTGLPAFLKDQNESCGWNDFFLSEPFSLNVEGFISAMELVHSGEFTAFYKEEFEKYYQAMLPLARKALEKGCKLYILQT